MPRISATVLQTTFDFDLFIADPVVVTPAVQSPIFGVDAAPLIPPVNDNQVALTTEALLEVLKQKLSRSP